MHWEILDRPRRKLLPSLAFLKRYRFYLAGGTALALHLGHRRSVDFDFYTPESFSELEFEQEMVRRFEGIKVTQRSAGTLLGQVGAIEVTFFYYPYPLIEPLLEEEGILIASIADIAAMKLIALSQRGLRRDFLDLYVIARDRGLERIFEWAAQKFTQFDRYVALKALAYFKDADGDESGRGMALENRTPWPKIRSFFEKEAIALSRKWL